MRGSCPPAVSHRRGRRTGRELPARSSPAIAPQPSNPQSWARETPQVTTDVSRSGRSSARAPKRACRKRSRPSADRYHREWQRRCPSRQFNLFRAAPASGFKPGRIPMPGVSSCQEGSGIHRSFNPSPGKVCFVQGNADLGEALAILP